MLGALSILLGRLQWLTKMCVSVYVVKSSAGHLNDLATGMKQFRQLHTQCLVIDLMCLFVRYM